MGRARLLDEIDCELAGCTRLWPTPDELAVKTIPDVTWDAAVDELLDSTTSMLKGYVAGLHSQGMIRDRARIFTRGGMAFGLVFFVGSERWLIMPLNRWLPMQSTEQAA